MPLLCARYSPWLYEVFKSFTWANLVIAKNLHQLPTATYSSDSAYLYGLDSHALYQSVIIWGGVLVLIAVADIVTFAFHSLQRQSLRSANRNVNLNEAPSFLDRMRRQFRYNVYIRFLMLAYFDLITVSLMGLNDKGKNWLNFTKLLSLIAVIVLFIIPATVVIACFVKFEFFLNKKSKKSMGALLEKIDKGSRNRVIQPGFFFIRRLITAWLITWSSST
jgi:hypothetical protein